MIFQERIYDDSSYMVMQNILIVQYPFYFSVYLGKFVIATTLVFAAKYLQLLKILISLYPITIS